MLAGRHRGRSIPMQRHRRSISSEEFIVRNSVRSWSRSRKIGAPNDKPRLCLEVLESRTLLDGSLGMLRPLHAPGTPNFDQTPSPSRPREIGPSLHLDGGFNGIGYPGVEGFSVPPDTIGAAGPNHYVEVVNSGIGIYKKGGTVVSTTAESTFFHASSIQNLGDGGVMFDDSVDNAAGKPAGRFIVWALDFSFGDFYFAVSNDADPTHGFTEKHQVDMTQGHFFFPDYPRFGMNADSYVF